MTLLPTSKLTSVTVETLAKGKRRYIGHFADGTQRRIRESFRRYGQVAQISPCEYPPQGNWGAHRYPEEFVFGTARASVGRHQQPRLLAIVDLD